jgi:hypothetical protein
MRLAPQSGYLMILAIFFIMVIGFLGSALAYMMVSSSMSTVNYAQAERAFFIAEGGLEKASRALLTPFISGTAARDSCVGIASDSDLINSILGSGRFTVTAVGGTPYSAASTLTSAITNSATTVAVASTTGFAPSGKLLIDTEVINYAAISGNNFIGVVRGLSNSLASSHASGTYLSQYQCLLNSAGAVPNLTSPVAKTEVQVGVLLQNAWVVGVVSGNDFVLTQWNRPTELQWNNASYTDATYKNTLLSVSMLSNAEGWAVGTITGTTFNIIHYLNSTWAATPVAATCNTQTLNGVSSVSATEAWAVGNRYRVNSCSSGNYNYTIIRWNGTAWTALSNATTPSMPASSPTSQNLSDVKVIDTSGNGLGDFGFAVGVGGFILQYNGSTWTKITSPTTQQLNGLYVVSPNEAWAVGNAGVILKWNGTSWSTVTSPTNKVLISVKMLDTNDSGTADIGWAVGNNGTAVYYNGSTWSLNSPGGSNLQDSIVFGRNDAWVIGAAGRVVHWDGSAWTTFTSNVTTQLNSASKVYPRQKFTSNWSQVFY